MISGGGFDRTRGFLAVTALLLTSVFTLAHSRARATSGEATLSAAIPEVSLADSVRILTPMRALVSAADVARAEPRARTLLDSLAQTGQSETHVALELRDLLGQTLLQGKQRNHDETLEWLRETVRARAERYGDGDRGLVTSYGNLGMLLVARGEPDSAQTLFERALALAEQHYRAGDPRLCPSLNQLASAHQRKASYEEARRLYERALAIEEAHPDFAPSVQAATLNNLAILNKEVGDLDAARPLYKRALAIRERVDGPNHPRVAATLGNLASLLREQGEFAAALPLAERALRIREAAQGPDHPDLVFALIAIGIVQHELGDYDAARRCYERCVSIQEKALGEDAPELARSLNALGILLMDMGDYEQSEAVLLRALEIRERALGPAHPELADAISNLGLLMMQSGRTEASLPFIERAVAMRESLFAGEHDDLASNEINLGSALLDLGRLDGARTHFDRSLEMRRHMHGPGHPDVAQSLRHLALLELRAGDAARARPHFERALAIYDSTLGAGHLKVAECRGGLARCAFRMGDYEAAFAEARSAELSARDHARMTCRALSEREALEHERSRERWMDLLLESALGPLPSAARAAFDMLADGRALVLDEVAARRREVAAAADSAAQSRLARLVTARERVAFLLVGGQRGMSPEAFRERVAEARARAEEAERAVARGLGTPGLPALATREGRAESSPIESLLPPHAALVSYARFESEAGDFRALAFVLEAGNPEPRPVDLGSSVELDTLVARWRREAGREPLPIGLRAERERACAAAGLSLRRVVWDPIQAVLPSGVEHVFMVPEGPLHLVNLSALPSVGGSFLVESGPTMHLLSAERDLALPASRADASGELFAVGGVDFESSEPTEVASHYRGTLSRCFERTDLQFEPLPGSKREVDELAALWRERGDASRSLVLTSGRATEGVIKRHAPNWSLLHFATHGFVLEDRCGESRSSGREPLPLRLSGLVFAGANSEEARTEDGILTAEEISVLDLSRVQCAVLSACDTGVGHILAGEGVLGLRRAFVIAGTRGLLTSLWRVEDQSTRAWMTAFYHTWLDRGGSVSEAMQRASRAVLDERRSSGQSLHPFYWGAFVATGR